MLDPHFIGILRLDDDPTDPGTRLVVTGKMFAFYDRKGLKWVAKPGDITDGASIPAILKPIIGRSFTEPYIKAAVLHDIYCKNKQRTWRDTDAMFFDALTTSGVNVVTCRMMWAAVYMFGPHW